MAALAVNTIASQPAPQPANNSAPANGGAFDGALRAAIDSDNTQGGSTSSNTSAGSSGGTKDSGASSPSNTSSGSAASKTSDKSDTTNTAPAPGTKDSGGSAPNAGSASGKTADKSDTSETAPSTLNTPAQQFIQATPPANADDANNNAKTTDDDNKSAADILPANVTAATQNAGNTPALEDKLRRSVDTDDDRDAKSDAAKDSSSQTGKTDNQTSTDATASNDNVIVPQAALPVQQPTPPAPQPVQDDSDDNTAPAVQDASASKPVTQANAAQDAAQANIGKSAGFTPDASASQQQPVNLDAPTPASTQTSAPAPQQQTAPAQGQASSQTPPQPQSIQPQTTGQSTPAANAAQLIQSFGTKATDSDVKLRDDTDSKTDTPASDNSKPSSQPANTDAATRANQNAAQNSSAQTQDTGSQTQASNQPAPQPQAPQPANTNQTVSVMHAAAAATTSVAQSGTITSPPAVASTIHVGSASDVPQPNVAQLAIDIASKSTAGLKQFDIRLDPPELGRVDVKLSVDSSGQAQANLSVDRPETLHLLQNDSSNLARAIRDAGIDLSNNGLSFSLKGQERDSSNGSMPQRQRNLQARAAAGIDAVAQAASLTSINPLTGRAGLDIRV